jgi:hypothetical protein
LANLERAPLQKGAAAGDDAAKRVPRPSEIAASRRPAQ